MYTLLSGNRTSIWFRCFVSELCFFPFSAVTLSKVFILNRRIHYINSILLYTKRFFATYVEEVIWVCSLAWKIPWMEEPGRLQSMGSLRVGHDWVTSLSLFTFMHWRRKWQPTPVFLPGESQGRGAWWAAIYGVAQSRTRLKWLSINYFKEDAIVWLVIWW